MSKRRREPAALGEGQAAPKRHRAPRARDQETVAPEAAGDPPAAHKRHRKPRPEDAETLSSNIRAFREAAGWAQDELSHKTGLARSHISRLEKGTFDARLSTLGVLADVFKKQTADLLLPSPPSPKPKKRR